MSVPKHGILFRQWYIVVFHFVLNNNYIISGIVIFNKKIVIDAIKNIWGNAYIRCLSNYICEGISYKQI